MLEKDFGELLPFLAAGSVGSGSERYGFDDEVSRDHDFEPGFCIFLPGEEIVDRRSAFLLERAYAKLPKEYRGVKRQPISPVGGNRNGVIRTSDFYSAAVGSPTGDLPIEMWLTIYDSALAEAVNGEVFFDNFGEFSEIRNRIAEMPEDIRLKRLAGNLLIMGQSGQYNYARCLRHGEPEAAQLACNEFVNAAMKTVFLLHGRYMPYYKWSFRALRQLEGGDILAGKLSSLLLGALPDKASKAISDNPRGFTGNNAAKEDIIEEISSEIIALLRGKNVTDSAGTDLESHAYSINSRIRDGEIRNLHILAAV